MSKGLGMLMVSLTVLALSSEVAQAQEILLNCESGASGDQLTQRQSSYDSVSVRVGEVEAKICYSRPLARGRVIFGGLVPYDILWRTGANEPTTIYLPFAAEIAGIALAPGKYSIYTVPSTREWVVVVNAATSQGGRTRDQGEFKNEYIAEVRAQEVGRGLVMSESIDEYVEQLTIRSDPTGIDSTSIIVEWERTRVRIPVRARGS